MTGAAGFAGPHLLGLLGDAATPTREKLDLLDAAAVSSYVRELQPSAVFHLAAQASVGRSWEDPGETLRGNLDMTLNLLEAVRREAASAPVLLVGSGEIYGAPERLPVEEDAPLRPQNPYAVSKAACDLLGGQYADAHGLRVVRTRTFNHAGPGQSEEYVVGTLTRQVAEAELSGAPEAVLQVGNLEAARDFTDVRDVVRAYVAAIELPSGAYNVCSGLSLSVASLVEELGSVASVSVRAEVDPERVRAHEVPEIRGSAARLEEATGWRPEIPLARTLADALAAWRERLG